MMEYTVLFTHQKTKKAKTWQDGILRIITAQKRAVLYDEKNSKLDAVFITPDQIGPGEQIESDRFLIQIEELRDRSKAIGAATPPNADQSAVKPGNPYTSSALVPKVSQSQAPRIGLKRKKSGFVPPRQVQPKREEPNEMNLLTSSASHRSESAQAELQQRFQPMIPANGLFSLYSTTGSPALQNRGNLNVKSSPGATCNVQKQEHQILSRFALDNTSKQDVSVRKENDHTNSSPVDRPSIISVKCDGFSNVERSKSDQKPDKGAKKWQKYLDDENEEGDEESNHNSQESVPEELIMKRLAEYHSPNNFRPENISPLASKDSERLVKYIAPKLNVENVIPASNSFDLSESSTARVPEGPANLKRSATDILAIIRKKKEASAPSYSQDDRLQKHLEKDDHNFFQHHHTSSGESVEYISFIPSMTTDKQKLSDTDNSQDRDNDIRSETLSHSGEFDPETMKQDDVVLDSELQDSLHEMWNEDIEFDNTDKPLSQLNKVLGTDNTSSVEVYSSKMGVASSHETRAGQGGNMENEVSSSSQPENQIHSSQRCRLDDSSMLDCSVVTDSQNVTIGKCSAEESANFDIGFDINFSPLSNASVSDTEIYEPVNESQNCKNDRKFNTTPSNVEMDMDSQNETLSNSSRNSQKTCQSSNQANCDGTNEQVGMTSKSKGFLSTNIDNIGEPGEVSSRFEMDEPNISKGRSEMVGSCVSQVHEVCVPECESRQLSQNVHQSPLIHPSPHETSQLNSVHQISPKPNSSTIYKKLDELEFSPESEILFASQASLASFESRHILKKDMPNSVCGSKEHLETVTNKTNQRVPLGDSAIIEKCVERSADVAKTVCPSLQIPIAMTNSQCSDMLDKLQFSPDSEVISKSQNLGVFTSVPPNTSECSLPVCLPEEATLNEKAKNPKFEKLENSVMLMPEDPSCDANAIISDTCDNSRKLLNSKIFDDEERLNTSNNCHVPARSASLPSVRKIPEDSHESTPADRYPMIHDSIQVNYPNIETKSTRDPNHGLSPKRNQLYCSSNPMITLPQAMSRGIFPMEEEEVIPSTLRHDEREAFRERIRSLGRHGLGKNRDHESHASIHSHSTLPHPSELMAHGANKLKTEATSHREENLISLATAKLQNYTMKGTKSSCMVSRLANSYNEDLGSSLHRTHHRPAEDNQGHGIQEMRNRSSPVFTEWVPLGRNDSVDDCYRPVKQTIPAIDWSNISLQYGDDEEARTPATPEIPAGGSSSPLFYFNPVMSEINKHKLDQENMFLMTPGRAGTRGQPSPISHLVPQFSPAVVNQKSFYSPACIVPEEYESPKIAHHVAVDSRAAPDSETIDSDSQMSTISVTEGYHLSHTKKADQQIIEQHLSTSLRQPSASISEQMNVRQPLKTHPFQDDVVYDSFSQCTSASNAVGSNLTRTRMTPVVSGCDDACADMVPNAQAFEINKSPFIVSPNMGMKYTPKIVRNREFSVSDIGETSDNKPAWLDQDSLYDESFSLADSPYVPKLWFEKSQKPLRNRDQSISLISKAEDDIRDIQTPNTTTIEPKFVLDKHDRNYLDACISDVRGCAESPENQNELQRFSSGQDESRWSRFTAGDEHFPSKIGRHKSKDSTTEKALNIRSHGVDHLVPLSHASKQEIQLDSQSTNSSEDIPFPLDSDDTCDSTKVSNLTAKYLPSAVSTIPVHSDFSPGSVNMNSAPKHKMKGFKPPRMVGKNDIHVPEINHISTEFRTSVPGHPHGNQNNLCGDLHFPGPADVGNGGFPVRQIHIPVTFPSAAVYKQTLISALREFLNIQLMELAKVYHSALTQVDLSSYSASVDGVTDYRSGSSGPASSNPHCDHGVPSKIIQVKKDGPNKGRFFFVCSGARDKQCKFFKWADNDKCDKTDPGKQNKQLALSDSSSVMTYFKGQHISLYCECQLIRKAADHFKAHLKNFPPWVKKGIDFGESDQKKKLFLRLSRKESSSSYTKDDLWVVSQSLAFDRGYTFLAKSVFYGPRNNNEIEIEPLSGYSQSNWHNEITCHAVHAGNASNELLCISNIEEYVNPTSMPILPFLLSREINQNKFQGVQKKQIFYLGKETLEYAASKYIEKYNLNEDQAVVLCRVAAMLDQESSPSGNPAPILVHGVFGAGKSYLLAVIVLFLSEMFEESDTMTPGVPLHHRCLISSTTNVAVDRILLGLLELGFEDFVRVGSVRKIAKPVLPYSVHATGSDSQERRELQEMLRSDLIPSEKLFVRKTLEKLRKGENKKRLSEVRAVGVTCASCPFVCLNDLQFSVVLLDECSQMTEPSSLLPLARFQCHRLVLVGDPKQLNPTIQGSDPAHQEGLEQTMFDRLCKMGHETILLRTQYRCHPRISAIANTLFYDDKLQDGVSESFRKPLVGKLPTLCFIDVPGGQEHTEGGGSFCNPKEADLVVKIIASLVEQGLDPENIGVITLYRAQQSRILALMDECSSDSSLELKSIQVSTVDAFQGGERGVIILSCVRSNSVGFIDCSKRTNVALTRAKNHLLIVGHRRNLMRNPLWAQVIQHCQRHSDGLQRGEFFLKRYCQQTDSQENAENRVKTVKRKRGAKKNELEKDEDFLYDNNEPVKKLPRLSQCETSISGIDIATPSPPLSLESHCENVLSHNEPTRSENVIETGDYTNSGSESGSLVRNSSKQFKARRRKPFIELDPSFLFEDGSFLVSGGLDIESDDDLPSFL